MTIFSHCPPNQAVLNRARARTKHHKGAVSTPWEQVSNHCTPFFSKPHQHCISLVCSRKCREEMPEISLGLRLYHRSCILLFFSPLGHLSSQGQKLHRLEIIHSQQSLLAISFIILYNSGIYKGFFNSCFRTFSGIKVTLTGRKK